MIGPRPVGETPNGMYCELFNIVRRLRYAGFRRGAFRTLYNVRSCDQARIVFLRILSLLTGCPSCYKVQCNTVGFTLASPTRTRGWQHNVKHPSDHLCNNDCELLVEVINVMQKSLALGGPHINLVRHEAHVTVQFGVAESSQQP